MVAVGIAVIVVALVLALVVVIALDPGPSPGDVAIAYEQAWDRLDFESLWILSGTELRDSRSRRDFVAAKEQAYAGQRSLMSLVREVHVDEELVAFELAEVRTLVQLRDGGTVRNQVRLALRDGAWKVIGYHLQGESPARRPMPQPESP
jgi:hypothetical protein